MFNEYKKLHWDQTTFSVGRNGFIKTTGIELHAFQGEDKGLIDLHPLTSKKQTANCKISIPMDSIPDLVDRLTGMYNEAIASKRFAGLEE